MTNTRILVTGATGQLGRELLRAPWPAGHDIIGTDRRTLDFADPASLRDAVLAIGPDVIVNTAAYTAVDAAETDEAMARRVNADSVAELAKVASERGIRLLHFSTDYVFDGSKSDWYVESDEVAPLGAYGRTKQAGEEAALTHDGALVLRTAWVYGALGNNFVRTMLRLAQQRDTLGVVADQVGCPTATVDLARAVVGIVALPDAATQPIYHVASCESASWFQFARAILEHHIAEGRMEITPLTTAQYATPAARPANSRLDSSALRRDFGIGLPRWSSTMPSVRDEILDAGLE